MLGTYATLEIEMHRNIAWIWGICIGLGWVYSLMRGFRRHKEEKVKTVTGKIISAVWIGSGVTMTLLGFVGTATGFIHGWAVTPIMAIVLGIPYLASGIIVDNRLIRNLALGWWLGGIAMMIWPGRHMFIVFALMIVVFQIVPGMILRKQWKQEYGESR
jgi:hypothetical protein